MDVDPNAITITTAEEAERLLGVSPKHSSEVAAILSGSAGVGLLIRDEAGNLRPLTDDALLAVGYDVKANWPFNVISNENR